MVSIMISALMLAAAPESTGTCPLGDVDFAIVKHYESTGRDIEIPRTVSFRIFIQDLDQLATIQSKLQSMGMDVTVYDRPDGSTLINGNLRMPLDPIRLSEIRCELTTYLEDISAYYKGWGTGFQNGD